MKKVSLAAGLALLSALLVFACSFAQMEMEKGTKHVIKMMGDETTLQGKCGGHSGGTMHQMGCSKMGGGMMGQMGCGKMCHGMYCGMVGCEGEMGCCKREFFLCCKKELELSDEQVKVLRSIRIDFLKGNLRKEADLKIAHLEFKALMEDNKASLKEIEAKLKAVEKLRTDMKLSHIRAFRESKALLTPEQKEKLRESRGM
jgi:Spy/CpxP family protein refolding chaperone